jgi:hypothetical protein
MKSETYTYKDEKNDVTLAFSFPLNEKIVAQKAAFLELLKKAVEDLTTELK